MKFWHLENKNTYPAGIDQLLAVWQDGTREWRDNLGEIPEGFAQWSPYEKGPHAGAIALHMAATERWWVDKGICDMTIDENDPIIAYDLSIDLDNGIFPEPLDEPWEWYIEQLDSARKRTFELLRQIDGPEQVIGGETNKYSVEWIIGHLVQHDSYHGGQIVMLKTMMASSFLRG
ncbi:DinB family protein [Kamptonema cortianum]|nr:DinB family protein [Geitlerinema splendidum]MDK3161186.1 DinB family protein [Kamptonema cortianum]